MRRWEGRCLFVLSGQPGPSWARKGEEDSSWVRKAANLQASQCKALMNVSLLTLWHRPWLTGTADPGAGPRA